MTFICKNYRMLKFISLTHSFADQLVNCQGVADYWEDYQAWKKIPHKITDHPSTSFFGRQGLQKNWENGWPTLSLQDGINKKRQTSSLVFWGEVVPDWEIFWQVKYWMGREARPEIDADRRWIWINTKLYIYRDLAFAFLYVDGTHNDCLCTTCQKTGSCEEVVVVLKLLSHPRPRLVVPWCRKYLST